MIINRLGVDLSHYNSAADFGAMWAAGIRFVLHKSSEATSPDDKYAQRRKDMKATGHPFKWGAYQFGRGNDVNQQLEAHFRFAQPDADTGMFLDWEVAGMTTPMARDYLGKCDTKWGKMTSLYSYEAFLNEHLGPNPDVFFGLHPLWFAKYSTGPKLIQPSWNKYLFWQYSDGQNGPPPHTCPGVTGDVDENDFDGTEADLYAEWDAWMKTGLPNVLVVAPPPTAPQAAYGGNRKPVFDVVRPMVLGDTFSQRQVNQLDAVMNGWVAGGISRKTFFDLVRDMTPYGRFTQPQVDALDAALNAWEAAGKADAPPP